LKLWTFEKNEIFPEIPQIADDFCGGNEYNRNKSGKTGFSKEEDMYHSIKTAGLCGVQGYIVNAEIDVAEGFPKLELVGLAHNSVRESIERVRTALKNTGYLFPYKRVTINLAPAQIKKYGSHYDLPIAISILEALGIIKSDILRKSMFVGELSLSGELLPIKGILFSSRHTF